MACWLTECLLVSSTNSISNACLVCNTWLVLFAVNFIRASLFIRVLAVGKMCKSIRCKSGEIDLVPLRSFDTKTNGLLASVLVHICHICALCDWNGTLSANFLDWICCNRHKNKNICFRSSSLVYWWCFPYMLVLLVGCRFVVFTPKQTQPHSTRLLSKSLGDFSYFVCCCAEADCGTQNNK